MEPTDRHDDVHRALRRLPVPRAPRTLLPRVMEAVAAREKAARTWFTWPLAWQVASVGALVLLVGAVSWVSPAARAVVSSGMSSAPVAALESFAVTVIDRIAAASSVIAIVWDAFLQPIAGYLLAWIVLMSAACAGFAAMLGRVALGGAPQS